MQMAAEAIHDSERIMLGRQRLDNIANIDLHSGGLGAGHHRRDPMKESLDIENKLVWDRTAGEDYSVFARNPSTGDNEANSNLRPNTAEVRSGDKRSERQNNNERS